MTAPMIRGAQLPPAPVEPEYDVVGLPNEGGLDVLFLGDIWGIQCHWVPTEGNPKKGRSVLCTRFSDDCEYCGVRRSLWLGFAPIWNLVRKEKQVLRLGPDTAKVLIAHAGSVVSLRGMAVRLAKAGSGPTSGCTIDMTRCRVPGVIPEAHALGATVRRVLGCERLPDHDVRRDEAMDIPLSDEQGGV